MLSAPGRKDLTEKRHAARDGQGYVAMTESRARRNDVAPYMASMTLVSIDGMPGAQETARVSGAAGTAAASVELRHWMDTGGTAPFSSFPTLEQPFPEVQACGRVRKEKGATGNPFIKALQACPDSLFPRRGWLLSGLFVSHESSILAQCANLAAATCDYLIHKSHRTIS